MWQEKIGAVKAISAHKSPLIPTHGEWQPDTSVFVFHLCWWWSWYLEKECMCQPALFFYIKCIKAVIWKLSCDPFSLAHGWAARLSETESKRKLQKKATFVCLWATLYKGFLITAMLPRNFVKSNIIQDIYFNQNLPKLVETNLLRETFNYWRH